MAGTKGTKGGKDGTESLSLFPSVPMEGIDHLMALDRAYHRRRVELSTVFLDPDHYLGLRRVLMQRKDDEGRLNREEEDLVDVEGYSYLRLRTFLLDRRCQGGLTVMPEDQTNQRVRARSTSGARVSAASDDQDFYNFVGMHHIFCEHDRAVTSIKFAPLSPDLLAFASIDGTITLCHALDEPGVIHKLTGHTRPVTDFDWSLSGEDIVSVSLDKTMRVWRVVSGECLRVIQDRVELLAVTFHTVNNNVFVVGTVNGLLKFMNLSTGKEVQEILISDGDVRSVCVDKNGTHVFAADGMGVIHSLTEDPSSGHYIVTSRITISSRAPITCLAYCNRVSKGAAPLVLVNVAEDRLQLLKVVDPYQAILAPVASYVIHQQQFDIRSQFCPSLFVQDGLCFVTGSEDMSVLLYDVQRPGKPVNVLMGHSATVLGVSWNNSETLLASSDALGMVILWKRKGRVDGPAMKQESTKARTISDLVQATGSGKNTPPPSSPLS